MLTIACRRPNIYQIRTEKVYAGLVRLLWRTCRGDYTWKAVRSGVRLPHSRAQHRGKSRYVGVKVNHVDTTVLILFVMVPE